ncbi:hypothetical protein [Salsuginibacillus kocurii]|uniref:hypothetical protein n=1 Tax=Salsuginibacillus kocurii TaxID=427078 RepID=UPI0012EA3828|nr:hypothetical protein [Salsuginibacillus kocurii]
MNLLLTSCLQLLWLLEAKMNGEHAVTASAMKMKPITRLCLGESVSADAGIATDMSSLALQMFPQEVLGVMGF